MNERNQEIYRDGYEAYDYGETECDNPHTGIDAEYWSDGWEDAKEDHE